MHGVALVQILSLPKFRALLELILYARTSSSGGSENTADLVWLKGNCESKD
jgi:hypothetical protein